MLSANCHIVLLECPQCMTSCVSGICRRVPALYCAVLYFSVLFCLVLHFTSLYCTVLWWYTGEGKAKCSDKSCCTVLHCIVVVCR